MKALITTISLIFATLVLTGCAGRNPYEQAQFQQPAATVYRAAPTAVPYSNTNLQFQPLQRPAQVVQVQQTTQQTAFQKYLNSGSIPQQRQVQYQQAQYQQQQYQPQYQQQQRVQLSPQQRCQYNAQNRMADVEATFQAATQYNNDGFFSGATARTKYRQQKESVQRSYTSCMQSAERTVIRQQLQQQYQTQYQQPQYQQQQYQQTGYVRY